MNDTDPTPGAQLGADSDSEVRASKSLLPGEIRFVEGTSEVEPLDLMGYWRVLWKHRLTVLGVATATLLAALAATLLATPIYRATTSIQIDREALKVVEFDGDQRPVESGSASDFYQTQYELLQSRALARRVAGRLGLAQDPGFREIYESPADPATATQTAINVVQAGLTVDPIRNSRLVRVHFDSPDPEFSARVANAYADGFIASTLERRFDASSYARTYLEERLEQLKVRLEESERELVQFAQREQIVNSEEGQSLSAQNLSELNSEMAQAQAQRIRAEARWRQAAAGTGAGLSADMLANSIVRPLQQRRAELEAEFQDKLSVYKPAHPVMLQLRRQIDEVDRQVQRELGDIRASVKAEYDAALREEQLLSGTMASMRVEVLDLQSRSIRHNILGREVDTNRQLYDALLQRYKQIGVAGGVSTNNVSVIDSAEVPGNKFKPSLGKNLALALLAGLLAGCLAAFLLEYLDDTIRSPDELERAFGLPMLGSIPLLKSTSPMQAFADVRSPFAEAYRSVRTSLQFSTDAGVPKVLFVTSASPGEGKSTTALMLARNFAVLGRRVVLIDADLRNPSLHSTLGVSNSVGLSSYLAGAKPAEETVQSSEQENLFLISSGPLPPNPAELLSSPRMKVLLGKLRQEFDQVVIDGPPIMGLADAPVISHLADGSLLMVAAGKTRRGMLKMAAKRLVTARSTLVGAVVTMYDAKRDGAYGYGGYDYYTYGSAPDKSKAR